MQPRSTARHTRAQRLVWHGRSCRALPLRVRGSIAPPEAMDPVFQLKRTNGKGGNDHKCPHQRLSRSSPEAPAAPFNNSFDIASSKKDAAPQDCSSRGSDGDAGQFARGAAGHWTKLNTFSFSSNLRYSAKAFACMGLIVVYTFGGRKPRGKT